LSEAVATESISLGNIIAIGAAVVAVGAVAFSALSYRHNKKSEQIKIAREQLDRISTKYERFLEAKIGYLETEDGVTSPLIFLFHVEEIMKEREYLGYLIRKEMITDDYIISYYKPEITSIFVELMSPGRDAFQKMNEKRQGYPDLDENIDAHIKLVDKFVFSWG
jgi:hypothetical protein